MDNKNLDGIKWAKNGNGYWRSGVHGYQHIYVWQQSHQATVDKGDVIHHINGIKEDNRSENLQLMTKQDHRRLHGLGRKHTEESRIKMSKVQKGKFVSEETKKKISISLIGKMSGEKNPNYGKKPSKETRQKQAEAKKGKKQSPETIAKRVAGRKLYYQNKKDKECVTNDC